MLCIEILVSFLQLKKYLQPVHLFFLLLPFIIFTSSGGARMQEGIVSLMQMPRTIAAIQKVKENRKLMGATDPTKAEEGTIRKKFGISIDKNSLCGKQESLNRQ